MIAPARPPTNSSAAHSRVDRPSEGWLGLAAGADAPCPLGDSCPDAHKYGSVHPAPDAQPRTKAKLTELVRKWGRGEYADAHIIEDFTDFAEELETWNDALINQRASLQKEVLALECELAAANGRLLAYKEAFPKAVSDAETNANETARVLELLTVERAAREQAEREWKCLEIKYKEAFQIQYDRAEAAEKRCTRLEDELRRACSQHEGAAAKLFDAEQRLAAVEKLLRRVLSCGLNDGPDLGHLSKQEKLAGQLTTDIAAALAAAKEGKA